MKRKKNKDSSIKVIAEEDTLLPNSQQGSNSSRIT